MIHVLVKGQAGTSFGAFSLSEASEHIRQLLGDSTCFFWVDIEAAETCAYDLLVKVLGIEEDTAKFCRERALRPMAKNCPPHRDLNSTHCSYIVVHGPTTCKSIHKELDIFVAKSFIVTTHIAPMSDVKAVREELEGCPNMWRRGTDDVLRLLLDRMVMHYQDEVSRLAQGTDTLEDVRKPDFLLDLKRHKQGLIDLRSTLIPQRDVVSRLAQGDIEFVGQDCQSQLKDILSLIQSLVEQIDVHREMIFASREMYLATKSNDLADTSIQLTNTSNEMNRQMTRMTLVTVIGLPIAVITGFFGMNFEDMPHSAIAMITALVLMFLLVTMFLFVFRNELGTLIRAKR